MLNNRALRQASDYKTSAFSQSCIIILSINIYVDLPRSLSLKFNFGWKSKATLYNNRPFRSSQKVTKLLHEAEAKFDLAQLEVGGGGGKGGEKKKQQKKN